MHRFRIPTLVMAATVAAGLLLAAITGIAVLVAMRESLGPRLDPASDLLVREMILWAALAWLPFGALIGWFAGRRLADRLEVTRAFTRDLAWSESDSPPPPPPARVADVRRLEEALAGYFADLRDELTAALRHRDEALHLVNAVGEGLLQLDEEGRLLRLNPAAARLLHLPGEALGQPIGALVRQPDLRGLLERPVACDAAESCEVTVEDRRLLVLRQPLQQAPRPDGTVVLVVDLTSLRRLEDMRRDFVANVSHELKTPLTAIRGYIETLQDLDLSPELRRQFMEATLRNAERLQRIVDDLLDLSRIESGGWRPRPEAVDAGALATDAWSEFAERATQKGIVFTLVRDPANVPPVTADVGGLRQILCNLYDNALRYTDGGGRIEVRVARATLPERPGAPGVVAPAGARDAVTIAVSDTGTGIPAEALPRIFERFYRVDPSRSREAGGTGLGLSIVKHLAERMGGGAEAESRLGAGTTVRITLPVAAPSLVTVHPA